MMYEKSRLRAREGDYIYINIRISIQNGVILDCSGNKVVQLSSLGAAGAAGSRDGSYINLGDLGERVVECVGE